jgi:hypothetical protein
VKGDRHAPLETNHPQSRANVIAAGSTM